MRRILVVSAAAMLALTMTACSDELLDELGVSAEDREELEQLEDLVQDVAEAAQDAESGDGADGQPEDPRMEDRDGDGEPDYDPDWNPESFPPPPGEPDRSSDYTGQEGSCEPNQTCGWAEYRDDDGEAIRDHYEGEFGEPGETSEYPPSLDENGQPYNATQTTWRDGDTEVTVYTDHHGTDVHVRSAEG